MLSKLNAASSERRNPYEAARSRIVKSRSANGVAQSIARLLCARVSFSNVVDKDLEFYLINWFQIFHTHQLTLRTRI
jgi:hypothetical protein